MRVAQGEPPVAQRNPAIEGGLVDQANGFIEISYPMTIKTR
jgi:hypothetical protein